MEDLMEFIEFIEFVEEPTPRRYLRDLENPLEFFSDLEFYKRYSSRCFIGPDFKYIDYSTKRGLPIPPILQLNCFKILWIIKFPVSGDIRGINQATVSRIIKRISMSLASQFKHHINFPNTAEEWRLIQEQFYKMYKMPGIGGCIDCTHIKIQNPGGPDGEVFRNRKGYFSLNVQAICGLSMEFLDLVVRWPGSYHDSFIFNGSYANKYFSENTHGVKLLGDGGYACKSYLFTPLRNPTTAPERKYNKAQIRTRNIIERTFGLWKRRFSCLRRSLANAPQTIVNIIITCALLHNMAQKLVKKY